MRRVPFNPDALTGAQRDWWDKWSAKAQTATRELRESAERGETPDPESKAKIWAELKNWLLAHVFHDKCAYCEGSYGAHGPQDAEHWRPKKGVTSPVRDSRAEKVTDDDGDHPGYWWLACDWNNLIPGCKFCNSGHGKGTQFPIAGPYVFAPDEAADVDVLDAIEQPWLLHPWRGRDPANHISFDEDGYAVATDPDDDFAYWTITVLDLNRDKLVTERRQRQKHARDAYILALVNFLHNDIAMADAMQEWEGETARYSRAVQDQLDSLRESLRDQLDQPAC